MSEVKYAIAILKEKLANADRHNLAYQRLSIADMEAIWGVLAKSDTDYATLKSERDELSAKVKQLEWDSVFIPKDIEAALAVMGVALPESKEEFNFSINRWVQRLVDRVIRVGPELDAERNNLRAEGVEAFAHQQRVIADSLSGDEQRSHRITACRAEDFANQLRAGKDGKDA